MTFSAGSIWGQTPAAMITLLITSTVFYLFLPPFIFLVKWRSACKLMDLPLAAGFHSSWEISSLMSVGSWTLASRPVKNYLKVDYIWFILNKSSTGCFLWIGPWDVICVSSFGGYSPALLMKQHTMSGCELSWYAPNYLPPINLQLVCLLDTYNCHC